MRNSESRVGFPKKQLSSRQIKLNKIARTAVVPSFFCVVKTIKN